MSSELDYFARIAGDNTFREWLNKERAEVTKYLRVADGVALSRAQGRAVLIEEILDRMDKARKSG